MPNLIKAWALSSITYVLTLMKSGFLVRMVKVTSASNSARLFIVLHLIDIICTKNDVDAVVSFESFRALKLTLFESFRVLKYYDPI